MKKSHGGKREGAGRPPLTEGKPKKKRFPMATDGTWEFLKKIGKGNASKGIEIIVKEFELNTATIENGCLMCNGHKLEPASNSAKNEHGYDLAASWIDVAESGYTIWVSEDGNPYIQSALPPVR